MFLDYHPPHEEPEGAVQPAPAPRLRALLAGWIARGMTTTSQGDNDNDASPHHRCEQLLAGWIMGCKPRGPLTSQTPLTSARGFFLFSSTEWMTTTTTPPQQPQPRQPRRPHDDSTPNCHRVRSGDGVLNESTRKNTIQLYFSWL